jgi:hypothetical protein
MSTSPSIDKPTIPGRTTSYDYRITRRRSRVSTFRRLVGYGIVR